MVENAGVANFEAQLNDLRLDRFELGQILPSLQRESNRTIMSKECSRLDAEIKTREAALIEMKANQPEPQENAKEGRHPVFEDV